MDLREGERTIFEGHPSWRSVLGFYVKGVAVTALAGGLTVLVTLILDGRVRGGTTILVCLVVFAAVLIVGTLKRVATTYSITNQRLQIRRGIVARRVQQTRVERVQNVNTRQSVLERLLQVGTVDFETAGTDDSDFSFAGVSQPEHVVAAVEQAQHEQTAAAAAGDPRV